MILATNTERGIDETGAQGVCTIACIRVEVERFTLWKSLYFGFAGLAEGVNGRLALKDAMGFRDCFFS